MKLKKTFFVALTTVAAALALSVSASAVGLGETSDGSKPISNPDESSTPESSLPNPSSQPAPVTGDNSGATVAVLATAGVVALGTAIVATKMKKKASK